MHLEKQHKYSIGYSPTVKFGINFLVLKQCSERMVDYEIKGSGYLSLNCVDNITKGQKSGCSAHTAQLPRCAAHRKGDEQRATHL